MNEAHSVFDKDEDNEDGSMAVELENRKWSYYLLDFSKVKGVGELSLKAVCAEAGEKETLDYDLLDVPLYGTNEKVTHYQSMMGFRVGNVEAGKRDGRKVQRSAGVAKSKLQQKHEEAAARRGAAMKTDETGYVHSAFLFV